MKIRALLIVPVVGVLSMSLAACGDDSSSGNGSGGSSGAGAGGAGGSGGGPAGPCDNDADRAAATGMYMLDDGSMGVYTQVVRECGIGCLSAMDSTACTTDCLNMKTSNAISNACLPCFIASYSCGRDNCTAECIRSAAHEVGTDCNNCICGKAMPENMNPTVNCIATQFETCAGIKSTTCG